MAAFCSSEEDGKMVTPRRPRSGHTSNSRDSITVAVVGYVRFYREGLVQSLSRHRHLIVVDLGVGDQNSIERLVHLRPDVALVDLPAASAAQAVQQLTASTPRSRIIALAPEDSEVAILALLEAGISAFVPPSASDEDLVRAIEQAMRGELQLPPRITAALVARLRTSAGGRSDSSPQPQLTARESEIVGLLEQRLTNKEIASRLAVEAGTVKNHVHHILEKLSVHRRSEAVPTLRARGPRLGLIGPPRGPRRDPGRV
jgi:two-component system nitrate/nitrite response regulator NarL